MDKGAIVTGSRGLVPRLSRLDNAGYRSNLWAWRAPGPARICALMSADVSKPADATALVCVAELGPLTLMVNNAGSGENDWREHAPIGIWSSISIVAACSTCPAPYCP